MWKSLIDEFFSGKGFLARVQLRVHRHVAASSPSVKSAFGARPSSDDDDVAERIIALALNEWRGPGIGQGNPAAKKALIDRLRRSRQSDAPLWGS